jgi:hypothetical protein
MSVVRDREKWRGAVKKGNESSRHKTQNIS